MSEQTIYNALRNGGFSNAGACAMMGNMYCESLLKSNNVENRCSMSDSDYTWNVDHGNISKWQFMTDSYGYGLCQWTYHTRKEELYLYAKERKVSISDEQMQCEFCLAEMKRDYPKLYQFCCTMEDLQAATRRICAEYERPAVNNYADRINKATYYSNTLRLDDSTAEPPVMVEPAPIDFGGSETTDITVRVLKKGDMGRDVLLAQCGINDFGITLRLDGDFRTKTEEAVKEYQRACNLRVTGIVDTATWQTLFQ